MIKSIFVILALLIPVVGHSEDDRSKQIFNTATNLVSTNADYYPFFTQYRWSYGALAETMKEMRNQCEPTTQHEFLQIGNWMRSNGAQFSMNELKRAALGGQSKLFKKIDRDYVLEDGKRKGEKRECRLPYPEKCTVENGKIINCGEENWADDENESEFNIFVSTFLKHTNERANVIKHGKPGTYVRAYKPKFNDWKDKSPLTNTVWKIEDVVLHPDYWQSSDWTSENIPNYQVNRSVNEADENTKIYMINDDGTISDTGLHTWTNDMFFDVMASSDERGMVRGAFVNSYIWPNADLTEDIYKLYDKYRGSQTYALKQAYRSLNGMPNDIKRVYEDKFIIPGQKNAEPASNGVLFNGKVVNLDWLGHLLFGMIRGEAALNEELANNTAQALSQSNNINWMKALKTTTMVPLIGKEIALIGILSDMRKGDREPVHLQTAWDAGSDYAAEQKETNTNTNFAGHSVEKKESAISLVQDYIPRNIEGAENISCETTECRKGLSTPATEYDVVICTYSTPQKKYNRTEFIFKSICGKKQTNKFFM